MLKIDCFARQNECTKVLLALHANNWLYGRIFHNSRIFLQNINISNRIRFVTAQYSRFVSKFWTGISVHGDAEQEVVAHPFPPELPLLCAASVLPFNQCQCTSHYKLYSRPHCIVLTCVSGFYLSVAGIRTCDWRAARPCQPLQIRVSSTWKGAGEDNVPQLHTAASKCNAFMRCISALQRERETAI